LAGHILQKFFRHFRHAWSRMATIHNNVCGEYISTTTRLLKLNWSTQHTHEVNRQIYMHNACWNLHLACGCICILASQSNPAFVAKLGRSSYCQRCPCHGSRLPGCCCYGHFSANMVVVKSSIKCHFNFNHLRLTMIVFEWKCPLKGLTVHFDRDSCRGFCWNGKWQVATESRSLDAEGHTSHLHAAVVAVLAHYMIHVISAWGWNTLFFF
jgi:hypothetical protein